jgi:hypothetical protein
MTAAAMRRMRRTYGCRQGAQTQLVNGGSAADRKLMLDETGRLV